MEAYVSVTLHTGSFLHAPRGASEGLAAGALAAANGRIIAFDEAARLRQRFPDATQMAHPGLIVPGLVDTHVHFPQLAMAGAHGESLLDWLNRYTFPAELAFADSDQARARAQQFVKMLSRSGTTSAMIFGVSFERAMEHLFQAMNEAQMAGAAGLVWMDSEGPEGLLNDAKSCVDASNRLLNRFCSNGSLRYAILPRFAPSCSPEMLEASGHFLASNPDVHMQTHLSESSEEVAWVRSLFPQAKSYTEVYHQFGLCGPNSSFAHAIHLEDSELEVLSQTRSKIAHCPSANLFLGSGLFDYQRSREAGVSIGLGSDVGAGTSLCLLDVLRDFYGVQMTKGNRIPVGTMLHLATQAGADLLGLGNEIGSFEVGKRADFIAIRPIWDDLFAARWSQCQSMEDQFFAAAMLGGTSSIASTTIAGRTAIHPG